MDVCMYWINYVCNTKISIQNLQIDMNQVHFVSGSILKFYKYSQTQNIEI